MYDELIRRLRVNGELFQKYIPNAEGEILLQAADAIEELQKRVELEYQSGFADGQRAANRKKNKWISVEEPPKEE